MKENVCFALAFSIARMYSSATKKLDLVRSPVVQGVRCVTLLTSEGFQVSNPLTCQNIFQNGCELFYHICKALWTVFQFTQT